MREVSRRMDILIIRSATSAAFALRFILVSTQRIIVTYAVQYLALGKDIFPGKGFVRHNSHYRGMVLRILRQLADLLMRIITLSTTAPRGVSLQMLLERYRKITWFTRAQLVILAHSIAVLTTISTVRVAQPLPAQIPKRELR